VSRPDGLVVEQAARDGPAAGWLGSVPGIIQQAAGRWQLDVDDGEPMHGGFAEVVPARRGRRPASSAGLARELGAAAGDRLVHADLHYGNIVRCVDYWLWALENGLTEDPGRCRRIIEILMGEPPCR
jgi:hypothetical protein